MSFLILFMTLSSAGSVAQLHAHTIDGAPRIPPTLIVGRAVCGQSTRLLTERADLIVMTHATRNVAVRAVKGLQLTDTPWGLACLADGSLWTLGTARTLVRISEEGVVRERVELKAPRLVLFGFADRLLFIDMPVLLATPLLTTALPRGKGESRPWPQFLARATASRADLFARNFVNCGIGDGRSLPCWFADERKVIVSDGVNASAVSFATLHSPDVAAATPIWDLAMGSADSLWLLPGTGGGASGAVNGRRLIKTNKSGTELASVQLPSPARMILEATDTTCVLLAVDGTLVEVTTR
jgi:hypothetical protein